MTPIRPGASLRHERPRRRLALFRGRGRRKRSTWPRLRFRSTQAYGGGRAPNDASPTPARGHVSVPVVAEIPAACDRCGRMAPRLGVDTEGSNNRIGPITSGRCRCGGTYRSEPAIYSTDSAGSLTAIAATPEGAAALRRMGVLVEEMLAAGASPDEVKAEVARQAPDVAALLPATNQKLLAFAGAMIIAAGTAAVTPVASRAGERVADALFGAKAAASDSTVQLPAGSKGTITYPDGMKVRWGPGTRPTLEGSG